MSTISLTPESLFGPLEKKLPAGLPVTLIPVSAFPETLEGPKPSRTFVASVRSFGVVAPIIVKEDRRGPIEYRTQRYSLVDGNRRVMAAREMELDRIPARVVPELDDTAALTLALNGSRQDNPVTEYLAIKSFLERGLSESDIAKATGYPAAKIRARLALDNLHLELFAALSAQTITAAVAEAAAKLGPEPQKRLVEKLADDGRLTSTDVREVRQAEVACAVAELPFDPFEPSAVGPYDWRTLVRANLERALATVPAFGSCEDGTRAVIRAIRDVLAMLDLDPTGAASEEAA